MNSYVAANQDFYTLAQQAGLEHMLFDIEPAYVEEPRGRWKGQAEFVARPKSTQEVSALVGLCHRHNVAIIPYGGGTGLVGGQLAEDGVIPLILSLEKMTKIRAVFPEENVMIADAGAILSDIQAAAENVDRLFPLSLASGGSARIGGCLATNAGGVNVLRYGNTRDLCLGLEVVMADGEIWNGLGRLRKDNTGYDLRHLMIGSEGTLGIITGASLKLVPRPRDVGVALFTVSNPTAALSLLALARDEVGEAVSAFELMSKMGLDFLTETLPDVRQVLEDKPEWMVLIELGMGGAQSASDALERLFELGHDAGLVSDGVIAQSAQQANDIWTIRETIPEANRRIGSISSHDISLPLSMIPEFIKVAPSHLEKLCDMRINCFGHLGDGNLHYNVFPPKGRDKKEFWNLRDEIKRTVHDLVVSMGGSHSAEHGIGRLKVDDLERYSDPAKLSALHAIKGALDPKNILNPGAVLRR